MSRLGTTLVGLGSIMNKLNLTFYIWISISAGLWEISVGIVASSSGEGPWVWMTIH